MTDRATNAGHASEALWDLIRRYAACCANVAVNPTHVSAEAYRKMAESDLRAALRTPPAIVAEVELSDEDIMEIVEAHTAWNGSHAFHNYPAMIRAAIAAHRRAQTVADRPQPDGGAR